YLNYPPTTEIYTLSLHDALPILNTWDVRYTWHRLAHLDWDTIGRWQAQGFHFASHTASHQRLTWLSDDQAAAELERSRETLRQRDRKSTRLNSSHLGISYAVFCL